MAADMHALCVKMTDKGDGTMTGKRWKIITASTVIVMLIAGLVAWFIWHAQADIPGFLKRMGGDFTLESTDGPVSLQDFRGKAVLVYFGYTHCPDVCPMALGVISAAMHALDEPDKDYVAGIFVSLDPVRDSPQLLKQYAGFFDHRIVGVTGSPTMLEQVAAGWHVDYNVPQASAGDNYAVEHSTFIYLVNREGQIVELFDEKTAPSVIAQSIHRWLD